MSNVVLAYHAVGLCDQDPHNLFVPPDAFARQMESLSRRRVVPLEDLVSGRERGGIAITFDDAYASVLHHAVPLLEKYGLTATVFVPTAFVGERNSWDEPTDCDLSIASADELREMAARKVSLQSHGHRHLDMTAHDSATVEEDIKASLEILRELGSSDPPLLAYPYGRVNQGAEEAVRRAGIHAAFTLDRPADGPYAMSRIQVTPLDGSRLFALKCSGYYGALRYSKFGARAYATVKRPVRKLFGR